MQHLFLISPLITIFLIFHTKYFFKDLENVKKLTNALSSLMSVMSSNQVAGEEPAIGKTEAFEFIAERVEMEQLSNKTVGGGKASLPSSSDLLGNLTVVGAVDIQVSYVLIFGFVSLFKKFIQFKNSYFLIPLFILLVKTEIYPAVLLL